MASVRFGIDVRRAAQRRARLDADRSLDVILFCAGLIIWAMVMLLALDNLGVQIKPLLAGLGIGGIAVASCRADGAQRRARLRVDCARQAVRCR